MAQDSTRRRRGANAAPEQQQQQPASPQQDEPLTLKDKASFYTAQHGGLVFCGIGIGLLGAGYDRGWMHNTYLCLLCLAICLIGLLFHELRPFKAQEVWEEQQKANSAAAN